MTDSPIFAAGLALLCIDLQPVFLHAMPDGPRVLQRCSFAVEVAQGLGVPIAFTEQVPQKMGGTDATLLALARNPSIWGKSSFSALADDRIRSALTEFDAEHLLLSGIETSVCVYQTALDALDAQYQVTVLSDAVSGRRTGDSDVALASLIRAGIHVLPSETVFYSLLHDAKHPFFKSYTQLVKKYG